MGYGKQGQGHLAEKSLLALEKSKKFKKCIATSLVKATAFYPAEGYHQQFYKKQKAYYERYKIGSGRAGFIEKNWK